MGKNAQVLLINFSEDEAKQVRKAGFGSDIGRTYENQSGVFLWMPRPIHEYDVYVYNSVGRNEIIESTNRPIHLQAGSKTCKELCDLTSFPIVRIAFVGGVSTAAESLIGTSHIAATKAHDNVSIVLPVNQNLPHSIEELQALIERSVNQVKLPLQQYLIPNGKANSHPYNFIPAFINRNGNLLAAYSTSYQRALPHYVALPQYKNNTLMLIKLLETFAQIEPTTFPEYVASNWEDEPEFWTPREEQLHAEISVVEEEAALIISNKKQDLASARNEFAYIKALLTAVETSETPPEERLSTRVKEVLTYLGFEVTDIDEKIASAIRKEDLWIRDQEFLAVGEINGTQKKTRKEPNTTIC